MTAGSEMCCEGLAARDDAGFVGAVGGFLVGPLAAPSPFPAAGRAHDLALGTDRCEGALDAFGWRGPLPGAEVRWASWRGWRAFGGRFDFRSSGAHWTILPI